MSATRLDTPFLDGGIRSTNFFNGRLLSREDMQREQDAERAVHERLGQALGAGIVRGFEVEAKAIGGNSVADPVVTVRAGLAVNRRGQTVALDRDVDVSLRKPAAPASNGAPPTGGFATCLPPDNTVYITGTGVYLLAAAPASQKQGLAVVSGLNNTAAACNAKELIEGVQFRLFEVKLAPAELADEAHLRNVMAYKFFAAEGAGLEAVRDPFAAASAPPELIFPALTDCDVPLALLHWTALGGLRFADMWSVRRGLALAPLRGQVPLWPADPPHTALGEAMFFQFQDHIEALRLAPPLTAKDAFRWLPPVGLLPLGSGGVAGFNATAFFSGLTTRGPLFIEGARGRALLQLATSFPPIQVPVPGQAGAPELVWLYRVRENQPPPGVAPPKPYLIFALGRLPCQVDPRFDVSHWNQASFVLGGEPTGI